MRIDWAETAEADIDDIVRWIPKDSVTAAFEIEDQIRSAAASLDIMAHRTRAGRIHGTREMVLSGTPYVIVFKVEPDLVSILRILHGAQNWPPRET